MPIGHTDLTSTDGQFIIAALREKFIITLNIATRITNELEQLHSTLSGLVPSARTDIVILFTILLWTGIIAVNTLPELNDSISSRIYPNLAPYKVWLWTTVYALLLGAAGTSTYNLLDGLANSAQLALLVTSILWFIVSCFRSPFLLSILQNLERPHGVISNWGSIKYFFASAWAKKIRILKKNYYVS